MGEEYGPEKTAVWGYVSPLSRLLLYDDLEGLLKWTAVSGLMDALPVKDNLAAYQGDYGCRISSILLVPNGLSWGYAGREFQYRLSKVIRISVRFRSHIVQVEGFRIRVYLYWEGYKYRAQMEYLFGVNDRYWHEMIMTLDMLNGAYGPCRVDSTETFHEGNPIFKGVNPGGETGALLTLAVGTYSARRKYAYFDLVLVEEV